MHFKPYNFVLFLLCAAPLKGVAQYLPDELTNRAGQAVSPLFLLIESRENLLWGNNNDYSTCNQHRDPAHQRLVGNLLQHLYYPAMIKAGYHSFSVIRKEHNQQLSVGTDEELDQLFTQSGYEFNRDDGRATQTYAYNPDGWLCAVHTTFLNPNAEGYSTDTDSLFYTFRADSTVQIRFRRDHHSSGSGYAGNSKCPELKARHHHIIQHNRSDIELDRWHNIIRISQQNSERWDDCDAGGPTWWKSNTTFDERGLLRSHESSASNGSGTVSEITYERTDLRRVTDTLKNAAIRSLFSHPAIVRWMKEQDAATFVTVRSKWVYISDAKDHPRSEQLRTEYLVTDRDNNTKIAFPAQNSYADDAAYFRFYNAAQEPATKTTGYVVQRFAPPVEADLKSIYLTTADAAIRWERTWKNYQLILVGTVPVREEAIEPNVSPTEISFGGIHKIPLPKTASSAAFIDPKGLVRYLFSHNNLYQLSYQ